jgi:uncharacterized repeat protein (TIGR01451 family)
VSPAPASLFVGGTWVNTVSVTNLGPAAATGVMVTSALSSGGQVSTNLGTLAAGARATVTLRLEVPVEGSITNTTTVAGNEVDTNPANNSARIVTTVISPISATLSGSVSDGAFQLIVNAQPDFTYVIEGSTNLVSWQPLSTNTASSSGTIKFTDTASPNLHQRFYRTRQLSP